MLTTHRPIGVVGGSVNKANQTAAEIVAEMVKETEVALNSAALFINPAAKL
jgi:hypothetical protein